ncbi:MAG: hypothetical protein NT154_09855 [Verrucomicrobia bacterium]|nr:hypothetical protein [Verrucomicrobiota bacterium]
MAALFFRITRNDISPALSKLAACAKRPEPVFRAMGTTFLSLTMGNFKSADYRPAELALELARVTPGSAPGCLPKREIRTALRAIIRNLRAQALQAATSTKSIRKYAVRAFKEAGEV